MAKHDILDEEDFFSRPDNDNEPTGITAKDVIDEGGFDDETEVQPTFTLPETETVSDMKEDIDTNHLAEDEDEAPNTYVDEYEEQRKPNYKPILISIIIILLITAGYFVVTTYILPSTNSIAGKDASPEKTPKQTGPTPEQVERSRKLGQYAAQTAADVDAINSVIGGSDKSLKISSIILYNGSLLLEVFATDREQLAKFNLKLRSVFTQERYEIISDRSRTGRLAGIFGIFELNLPAPPPGRGNNVDKPFKTVEAAKNNITTLSAANNIRVDNLKISSGGNENGFSVGKITASLSGSKSDLNSLLSHIASSHKNITIYELKLMPKDQGNFNDKNFMMSLILKIFI
jgi:hypothetical protein